MYIRLRQKTKNFPQNSLRRGCVCQSRLRSLGRGAFEGVGLFSFLVTFQTAANCRASPLCFAKKQGNRGENLRFSSVIFKPRCFRFSRKYLRRVRVCQSRLRSLGRGEFEGVGLFSFFGDLANNDKRLCFVPLFSVFPKLSAQGVSAKVACAPLAEGSLWVSDFFLFLVT